MPTLLTTGSFDVTDAVAIVGLAAPDVEAVLRFTADDGTVSEAPVASVREDWPFLVAVLAVTSTGTAELVAADGTVLTTREITETDLVLGGVDIGVATTVAAG